MKFVNTNRTDNGEGKPLCTCTCCLAPLFYIKYVKVRGGTYFYFFYERGKKAMCYN